MGDVSSWGIRVQGHQLVKWDEWHDRGVALLQRATDRTWGLYHLAARCFKTSLRLRPRLPAAHYHLGYAIASLRENAGDDWRWKARTSFELATLGQTQVAYEGLAWFHVAQDDAHGAYVALTRGMKALCQLDDHESPTSCATSLEFLFRWWDALQQACVFADWERGRRVLEAALKASFLPDQPQDIMSMSQGMRAPISDELRKQVASTYWKLLSRQSQFPSKVAKFSSSLLGPKRRVRVGYVSFNFSPTRNLNGVVNCFPTSADHHSHQDCFAIYGHHHKDSEEDVDRILSETDEFIDLQRVCAIEFSNTSDYHMAIKINEHEVNMVYAATTGGPSIDLFVTDRVATPPDLHAATLSERVLVLPGSHFINNQKDLMPQGFSSPPTRQEFSLPLSGVLLACFNAFFKITPDILDLWLHILLSVPQSFLLFVKYQYHQAARRNILQVVKQKNISSARIIFMNRTASLRDHMRRTSLSDVYLDTRLYNAHTIAVDVLWSGVPIVALPGTSLASRVTARDPHDYVDLTRAWVRARPSAANARAREAFKNLRRDGEIFDGDRFARKLEKGFLIALDAKDAGNVGSNYLVSE
ncbi:hypothetical protein GUITHDRAFT_145209 [Guillardia theta CCMP2712]|uniref:O-GlcNAc transferase C-terminal domain-containing protein n=1 Tax=Guillardia theta (strain CCMP2712) TaxID=905079 RepID=L1IMQ7_GUITC|nr:hypothetical protein GUITHDRAFT_145209 [Guillardia theta CCMP2712]EKX37095.1 hypothetical protein GUITHDRAFT_145209 [Guillardia theta CCMP2712]|eukprot:XP_005824075.1 hypothetical protein GUITHDRAFT_145209 [Guillardia theta CCMP2712]